jgi:A/G-specific adenine glycosylase
MSSSISKNLLAWYEIHQRQLPWRESQDPYAVWISEIMLQQTRVETVIPYYQRWFDRFPDLKTLAAVEIEEVLKLWEGLGYYRRAHNLHAAARIVVDEFEGIFPHEVARLQALPGIGRYSAAAIAAIAFNADEVALDGNLKRVLSRIIDLEVDVRSSQGEKTLMAAAERIMPPGRASEFNQALMDLGSSICLPKLPDCETCPISSDCLAFERGVQEQRPVRKKKAAIPHYTVVAGVLRKGERVLIAQRPEDKMLAGLWEFPGGKCELNESLDACLKREWEEELGVKIQVEEKIGVFTHAYTHFKITLHAFYCCLTAGEPSAKEHLSLDWVRPRDLEHFPMGKIDRSISKTIIN